MSKYNYRIDLEADSAIAKLLRLVEKDKDILEIGPGSGHVTDVLSREFNSNVTCIEIDPEAAEEAAKFCDQMIVADIESLDLAETFPGRQFDIIFLADILEHLKSPHIILERLHPLLREDGYLLISIPNITFWGVLLNLIQGKFDYTEYGILDNTHLRFFSKTSFINLLKEKSYFVSYINHAAPPIAETEFNLDLATFPRELINYLILLNDEFNSYQLIFKAHKNPGLPHIEECGETSLKLLDSLKRDKDKAAFLAKEVMQLLDERFSRRLETYIEFEKNSAKIIKLNKQLYEASGLLQAKEHELCSLKNELQTREEDLTRKERELIALDSKMQDYTRQSEANLAYLKELNMELSQEMARMRATKVWRFWLKYHAIRNKIRFFSSHPRFLFSALKQKILGATAVPYIPERCFPENREQPLISVIIPIYDRTVELQQSINSILNQTFKEFELLLICDGSPQETLNIVAQYENHPKVRIFKYLDNSGNAVRGRNRGIKEAQGTYVAFQDSDDIAEQDRLARQYVEMEKNSDDVTYGGWRALIEGGRKVDGLENGQEVFSPDCNLQSLLEMCVPCQSTVMARTDVLRQAGGLKPEMRYCEDYELWLRLAHQNFSFKAIQAILTNLRLHENNLEQSFASQVKEWQAKARAEYIKPTSLRPVIGYIIPGCGIGGGIAVVCQHVNRLLQRGYDVILINTDDRANDLSWFPNQKVPIYSYSEIPRIDIAIATGWNTAYVLKDYPCKRKIYFVQSDERRFYHETHSKNEAQKLSQQVHATYEMDFEFMTEAKWIQKMLKNEFGKKALLVPNGLDDKIHYPDTPLEEKGEKVRVLLEGPIDIPFKGMPESFEAVKDLDCEIWCVSSAGRLKPSWHCDRFYEKVPFNEMRSIYNACDILLKLSRIEGYFGPPLEMMACGGACVVGRVTGYDEYIIDGYNALVVDPTDVQEAREAVNTLINNPELRKKLIENGQRTAAEHSWDASIDLLESFFLDRNYYGSSHK